MCGKGLPTAKISIAILLCASALAHSQVSPIPATWNGGVGNWEDPTQWSGIPGIFPNDDGTNYYATTIGAGSVTVNSAIAVNQLSITGGSVDIQPSTSLDVESISGATFPTAVVTNAAQLQVDGQMNVEGYFTLSGSLTGSGSISAVPATYPGRGGIFDWNAGQISGSGTLYIAENYYIATFDSSSAPLYFGGWTIVNGFTWIGNNDIINTGGGTIRVWDNDLVLDADSTFGVPASPGVAPITILLGLDSIVKDSPGTTRLQNVIIADQDFYSGGLNVSQGTLESDNPLCISHVQIDGILDTPSLSTTYLSGHGTINARVSAGCILLNDAVPAKLTINGNLDFPNVLYEGDGQTLALDVLGPGDGQHDLLAVDGNFSLDGSASPTAYWNIELDFAGYVPNAGDTFDIVTYNSLNNYFDPTLTYTGLAPGFEFSITPTANALVFTALNDAQPVPEPTAIYILPIGFLLGHKIKRTAKVLAS
jgi:hypothetical protein